MNSIYCDNNATTRVLPEVLQAMLPCYGESYGNASSIHAFGQEAKVILDRARLQVASLLSVDPNEIVFTSGGTESDNLAIRGIVDAAPGAEKHIITTQIEHHAVLHCCRALEKNGVKLTYVPVDAEGLVDPAAIEKAITPHTLLISVMHSNNEIGTCQPIREIAEVAKRHDVYFHTDAVQAAGKVPLSTQDLGVDLLSISGHKFHGPKGAGALFVRKGTRLRPLFYGGAHERNRRAGTENVPQIAGLGAAADLSSRELSSRITAMAEIRDYFERGVMERIPGSHINGCIHSRIPNTSNIRFDGAESEPLVINLDLNGIACSTGSACSSGSIEPSHVLLALGLTSAQAFSSVRFSFSRLTVSTRSSASSQKI